MYTQVLAPRANQWPAKAALTEGITERLRLILNRSWESNRPTYIQSAEPLNTHGSEHPRHCIRDASQLQQVRHSAREFSQSDVPWQHDAAALDPSLAP